MAATRPSPDARLQSCCATTPRRSTESTARTCSRLSSGHTLRMRSTAREAELAWSVPKTSTPDSAAERARETVSWSRISPTTSTSGDSRSDERCAWRKLAAWTPTCRCVTTLLSGAWMNSTGSSMVMTWRRCVALISWIIAASVVVLPEPVGPVTSTSPFWCPGELADHRRELELVDRGHRPRGSPGRPRRPRATGGRR